MNYPHTWPVTLGFDSFYLRLNKRLSKQTWGWWFETPLPPLWRHCNDTSGNWSAISSNNGLSPFRCQTAILTKNGLLLIRPLATKWRSFSLGLNVLTCHFSYHQDFLLLNTMSIRLKSTTFDKQIYDKFSARYIFLLLTSPWLHSVFNNRCNNWHKVCRPRVRPRYGWQSPQFLSLFITCVRCDNEAPIIETIDCTKLQVGNGVDLMIKHTDMVFCHKQHYFQQTFLF